MPNCKWCKKPFTPSKEGNEFCGFRCLGKYNWHLAENHGLPPVRKNNDPPECLDIF